MQQYLDMKTECPGTVLLFRLGDFYESFFDDAKIVSRALDLVLTRRGTGADGAEIPMCGVPWHAFDNYMARLVRAGHSVAIAEQMESPEEARERGHKQIERKIVRILTAGTLTDENLLSPKKSNFLIAVFPKPVDKISNLKSQISNFEIAGCDISTGEFFTGELSGDSLMDEMIRLAPAEIIFPESSAEIPEIQRIRAAFKTVPVYDKLYDRADIGQIAQRIFGYDLGQFEGRTGQGAGSLYRSQSAQVRAQAGLNIKDKNSDADNFELKTYNQPALCALRPSTSASAVALLAGYLDMTQRGATLSFRAPYRLGAGRRLLIDAATWRSLEIDEPIQAGGATLLGVIDKTRTSAGARKLRAILRELSGDARVIQRRQEHVEHMVRHPDITASIRTALGRVPDIGRAISRLLSNRGTPRDLRGVMEFAKSLPGMKVLGKKLDADLAAQFDGLDTNDELVVELIASLSDELPTFFRDGGVIRAGYDAALDNMNSLAHGAREVIAKLQSEYAAKAAATNLKIKYNNILGYHIEVPSRQADKLFAPESGFIHRQTMVGSVRFTTARLIEMDNEVRGAAERASGIEAEIVARIIEMIRDASPSLLRAADILADVDVWAALAECAEEYEWVRPTITEDQSFDVVGGRHPVVEKILRDRAEQFVKNDCCLGCDHGIQVEERRAQSEGINNQGLPTSNSPALCALRSSTSPKCIALLTGPNMAGKSTYLRQNALIVVLAHLGSFVPAMSARIGICDQLFSRVGASDNLAAGQSTFMVEMTETANILNRATEKSFIIFDEIGRGTATFDGLSIAWAVLEFLDKLAPRTLFATHYHELTALACSDVTGDTKQVTGNSSHVSRITCHLSRVNCLTVEVREHNNEIIFMHKVLPGVATSSYGIHVAQMAGMPESVVRRAEEVLAQLEDNGSQVEDRSKSAGRRAQGEKVKEHTGQREDKTSKASAEATPALCALRPSTCHKAQMSLFGD